MMNKPKRKFALCLLCAIAHGMAQDDDPRQTRYDKIMEDSASVDLTMRIDRREYLPGEGVTFSIVVKNKTTERLEILKPFSDINFFMPYLLKPSGQRVELVPAPSLSPVILDTSGNVELSTPNFDIKTVSLGPGQEITASTQSFTAGRIGGSNQAQEDPGNYEIEYQYGMSGQRISARYQVVPAELGASSLAIKMPRNESMIPDGKKEGDKITLFTYRQAFELVTGGMTYLCVSPIDISFEHELSLVGKAAARLGTRPDVFLRVAESTSSFKDLTFTVANNEDLTLTWKDTQGRLQVLKLDKNLVKKRAED